MSTYPARISLHVGLLVCVVLCFGSACYGATRVEQQARAIEEALVQETPSLALKVVYHSLPVAQRVALMQHVKGMLLAQLPADLLENPQLDGLPPQAVKALEAALIFLQATDPAQMEQIVASMDLDHFCPLPPPVFRLYHDRMLSSEAPGTGLSRRALLEQDAALGAALADLIQKTPGYLNASEVPLESVQVLSRGSAVPANEVPVESVTPSGIDGVFEATRLGPFSECAMVNSQRLAKALCHLTNPRYLTHPMEVRVGDMTRQVRNGVELLNAVLASGEFDVRLYDGRMFVNFLHYSVEHGGNVLPVRIPTWCLTSVDPANPHSGSSFGARRGRPFIVPMNHSEHLLVFYHKNSDEPAALIKWYMGLPSSDYSQGTLFKAGIWQRESWCGYRIVHSYDDVAVVRRMIQSSSLLMQLFNYVQGRLRLPMNGYGCLAVCQDTTGLMEAILQGSAARATVWPLVRDPQLDFYYGAVLEQLGLSMGSNEGTSVVLDVPSDVRPDLYPWTLEPASLLYRIGTNVPFRRPDGLHLPLFREDVEQLIETSPSFARGLALFN